MRISRSRAPMMLMPPTPEMRSTRSFTSFSAKSDRSRREIGPPSTIVMKPTADRSNFWTTGSSTSTGSSGLARATLSRTSCTLVSMSYASANSRWTRERPCEEVEEMLRTPSMELSCSSRTSVTSRSTVSGEAPRSSVTTIAKGKSMSGSSFSSSRPSETTPSTTSPRISIAAKTGRRIETSASLMDPTPAARSSRRRLALGGRGPRAVLAHLDARPVGEPRGGLPAHDQVALGDAGEHLRALAVDDAHPHRREAHHAVLDPQHEGATVAREQRRAVHHRARLCARRRELGARVGARLQQAARVAHAAAHLVGARARVHAPAHALDRRLDGIGESLHEE